MVELEYGTLCVYIHRHIEKFWELFLKDLVYKRIEFEEKKQQLFTNIPMEISEYVN